MLALVFMCVLALVFFRTCGPVCKKGTPEKPLTLEEKRFKLFYGILWIAVLLIDVNYWTLSIGLLNNDKVERKDFFRLFVLIYIPPCLLVVGYGVLYD